MSILKGHIKQGCEYDIPHRARALFLLGQLSADVRAGPDIMAVASSQRWRDRYGHVVRAPALCAEVEGTGSWRMICKPSANGVAAGSSSVRWRAIRRRCRTPWCSWCLAGPRASGARAARAALYVVTTVGGAAGCAAWPVGRFVRLSPTLLAPAVTPVAGPRTSAWPCSRCGSPPRDQGCRGLQQQQGSMRSTQTSGRCRTLLQGARLTTRLPCGTACSPQLLFELESEGIIVEGTWKLDGARPQVIALMGVADASRPPAHANGDGATSATSPRAAAPPPPPPRAASLAPGGGSGVQASPYSEGSLLTQVCGAAAAVPWAGMRRGSATAAFFAMLRPRFRQRAVKALTSHARAFGAGSQVWARNST